MVVFVGMCMIVFAGMCVIVFVGMCMIVFFVLDGDRHGVLLILMLDCFIPHPEATIESITLWRSR